MMQPESLQTITMRQAAQMVNSPVQELINGFAFGGSSTTGSRWQHAVTLASQVSLKILDTLAPGHPAITAVDVFGHALTGILGTATTVSQD
jgi:hypothetical protein